MTDDFRMLKNYMEDTDIAKGYFANENAVRNTCLFQIATSMSKIEDSLKHIETELKGIKGRI